MALTLRVSSYQGDAMGTDGTRVFQAGGSIGRTRENDWVLPDPERFVSGRHAVIALEQGKYVLVDCSTNGTIVNGREMPRGGRVELRTGDLLTIGNYEVQVSVDSADLDFMQPQVSSPAPMQANPADAMSFDSGFGHEGSVDPLDFFADPAEPVQAPAPQWNPGGAESDHAPAHSEFFAPPQAFRDPSPPPGPAEAIPDTIPENWDDTSFSKPVVAPTPVPPTPAPPAPRPPSMPDVFTQTVVPPLPGAPEFQMPESTPAAAFQASASSPPAFQGTASPPSVGGEHRTDLNALLRAAGIDPANADEETLASLGEILRVVVEGVMEVLHSRAAIKNQFRVPTTTLKPVENNPLKFSPNADDALFNLFSRRSQSFKAPGDAFREAFDDLKAHQIAMMAGMRAAFGALLGRFDPDQLQESFDRGLKRSALLDVINRTKYWDLYREMYADLGNDDATFRRLFGDEFAQAYEEQMQRLTALRSEKQ